MRIIKKKPKGPPVEGKSLFEKRTDLVIRRILKQLPPALHKDITYLFKGKRIRSSLMFSLSSHLGCRVSQIVLPAVGVEIIHTISLIHDDVIDQQLVRREQPTLHRLYGNRAAVFIGDFLVLCLVEEMNHYRYRQEIIRVFYRKIAELCRGEVLQDIPTGIISPGRREYLQMIRQKTGSLFSYSFMVPVLLSGEKPPPPEVVDFAEECGYLFGLAFQLADDIADLEEDVEVIRNQQINKGKGDYSERLFSYPIMLWQEFDAPGFKDYLHNPSHSRLQEIREKVRDLTFAEINRQITQLGVKHQKLGDSCSTEIYRFLQENINHLFQGQSR